MYQNEYVHVLKPRLTWSWCLAGFGISQDIIHAFNESKTKFITGSTKIHIIKVALIINRPVQRFSMFVIHNNIYRAMQAA